MSKDWVPGQGTKILHAMTRPKKVEFGEFQVFQWLRLSTFTVEGSGSIPGQGTDPANLTVQQKEKKKFFK